MPCLRVDMSAGAGGVGRDRRLGAIAERQSTGWAGCYGYGNGTIMSNESAATWATAAARLISVRSEVQLPDGPLNALCNFGIASVPLRGPRNARYVQPPPVIPDRAVRG